VHPAGSSPVLIGVGAASADAGVAELMTRATQAAGADAGVPGLLSAVNDVLVPQGSWTLTDPGRSVARRIGAAAARTARYELGVSQQEMINHGLDMVARGQAGLVLVVGGEARAFERRGGTEVDDAGGSPDSTVARPPAFIAPVEAAAGIVWPVVQQYALIENALAAAEGLTPEQQRDEISGLWSRCNEVARHNPLAAFPAPRTAADIATPGPKNRPLASPYNLWHSTQWTVDQAAALLICSVERARALGVPADRWVFPHVALHSSQAITLTARGDLHRWPAMGVLGRAAAAHLGQPLAEVGLAEVYSCFPAAVRVQQRELGLPPGGTPTVTGGMAFAGGPFNNYVLQAMASVVPRLRERPGDRALVTTVSGMLSKPGLAVWSCTPPADEPCLGDRGAEASAVTDKRPVAEPGAARGPARVVSATVTYSDEDPLEPVRTAAVLDLADGWRTAATCEDPLIARSTLTEGLIGRAVHVDGATFTL
jgi:acetyl-CoA C-acetyltransferase